MPNRAALLRRCRKGRGTTSRAPETARRATRARRPPPVAKLTSGRHPRRNRSRAAHGRSDTTHHRAPATHVHPTTHQPPAPPAHEHHTHMHTHRDMHTHAQPPSLTLTPTSSYVPPCALCYNRGRRHSNSPFVSQGNGFEDTLSLRQHESTLLGLWCRGGGAGRLSGAAEARWADKIFKQ